MQIIEIERLSRDYGEGRGIFDISFSIAEGEVFGFLGPNGAGKTTTIRHLLGFLKAKQGSAKILGMDCWKQSDAITRQLGYIPGEINLLNEMSGEEFLRFMARYRNMQDSGRTQELLERDVYKRQMLCSALAAHIANIPKEIWPMVIFRPISGSASLAVLVDIFQVCGVDSLAGNMASIIQGSTDTKMCIRDSF